jgi:hypothetical protein
MAVADCGAERGNLQSIPAHGLCRALAQKASPNWPAQQAVGYGFLKRGATCRRSSDNNEKSKVLLRSIYEGFEVQMVGKAHEY